MKFTGITAKAAAVSLASIVMMLAMSLLWLVPSVEKRVMDEKQKKIHSVLDVAFELFRQYDEQVASGRISLEEAQTAVKDSIRRMRYDRTDYLWINDERALMIMHPYTREYEGKDMLDYRDPQGKAFFREILAICSARGEGFVSYSWHKPGTNKSNQKISYVRLFKPWGWILGTGVYIDDVEADIRALKRAIIGATAVLGLIMLFASAWMISVNARLLESGRQLKTAYTELAQAQSAALQQEKLASIGQLAAGVAHEINNPLSFVTSNFQYLCANMQAINDLVRKYQDMRDNVPKECPAMQSSADEIGRLEQDAGTQAILDDIPQLVKESQEGLERIRKIVDSMRAFARTDSSDEFGKIDVNQEVQSALLLARNELKYHADVKTEFGQIQPVSALAGQINQVLLNIIVNACHAIKSKKVKTPGLIAIKTWQEQGYVFCAITDNGSGISAKHRPRIFEPFFTTKAVGEGTGLGLSISYDIIVKKHHGDLLVESTEGIGSTFTIKLPVSQPAAPPVH